MAKKRITPPSMNELMDYLNKQTGQIDKRDVARAFGLKGDAKVALKGMLKDLKRDGKIQTQKGGRRVGISGALPERIIVEVTGLDSMGDLIARPTDQRDLKNLPQIVITKDRLSPPAGVGDIVQVKLKALGNHMYEAEALRRMTKSKNQMVMVYENGFVSSVDRRFKQTFKLSGAEGQSLHNRDIVIVD
ncbi:MAG: hypothetical protein LBU87_04860, partial [Lactobacillales bacterium]|nr:hypothetical protein [Lactobacillales bacterium]